jgi:uncharacterized membrane protein YoaK (UPF0700 family)
MDRLDRGRQRLAIGLAGLAGFVDSVGFLSADGYFVSFMSGNTTRLGVNLARQPALAIIPALLIAGFTLGVAGGAWLAVRAGARRKVAVIGLVCALLLLAAGLQHLAPHPLVLALLVMAMGALNNTFQRDGGIAVGLTYMTGALVRLGQALGARAAGIGANRKTAWAAHLALWGGLATGAVLGALAFTHAGTGALWLGAGWCAAMLAAAARLGPAGDTL